MRCTQFEIGWPKLQASRKLHALTIIIAWDTSRIFEVQYLKYAASILCNYTLTIIFLLSILPFSAEQISSLKIYSSEQVHNNYTGQVYNV